MISKSLPLRVFLLPGIPPSIRKKSFVDAFKHYKLTQDTQNLFGRDEQYKLTQDTQNLFGRDEQYNQHKTSVLLDIYHLHIIESPEIYVAYRDQFYNTTDEKHLVYCRGENPNQILLMDLLSPKAHEKATLSFISSACMVAGEFRRKY